MVKKQHSGENAVWLPKNVVWQLGEGANQFFGVSFDVECAKVVFVGE